MNLDEFAADQLEDLREEGLRRALKNAILQLEKAKNYKVEMVDAARIAARDAVQMLDLPAVSSPKSDKRKKVGEVAVAVLSDWQLAKITASYNSQVCEERVEMYGDKVIELTRIQREDHPVRSLHVDLLGDLVEGELVFPGQSHLLDASLFRQVMVDGPRILGNFLRRMSAEFEDVHVTGVIGNHGALGGRARKEYHPETNADAMMYEVTRMVMENHSTVTWAPNFTNRERHWYAVDRIGRFGFLLFHGDQIKGGFGGFPWYGFGKKIQGWRMGAVREPFDYALAGHFHTATRMTIGPIILWVNGSTESDNTYAAEMLAAMGTPSQWLLFAHPDRGVTAEYQVQLEER